MSLPVFFNYKEENTDNGYETIQDFFISWTLRCAVDNNDVNDRIYQYSRRILLYLIYGEIPDNVKIISVKTKRQWKQIDLLAEIVLEINNEKKYFILNIENKWYSPIRNGQLEKAIQYVKEKYSNKKYNFINIVVIPDFEKVDSISKSIPINSGYKIIIIEEILNKVCMIIQTGNYLFDEYWFKLHKVTRNILEEFKIYLKKNDYSITTPNGNPSTVYDYARRVKLICENENIKIDELISKISFYVKKYDSNGVEENFGKKSHNAYINALKRFEEFVNDACAQ